MDISSDCQSLLIKNLLSQLCCILFQTHSLFEISTTYIRYDPPCSFRLSIQDKICRYKN